MRFYLWSNYNFKFQPNDSRVKQHFCREKCNWLCKNPDPADCVMNEKEAEVYVLASRRWKLCDKRING